jgi:hypothetical protein
VLKVGETEVRKSAVGEASFAFMKAQQAEIQKARDEADMERLQKRAETEIGHLPGEAIAKAKVLKAINAMGEEDRKVLDTMLKAGEAAITKGFSTFGIKPARRRLRRSDRQARRPRQGARHQGRHVVCQGL